MGGRRFSSTRSSVFLSSPSFHPVVIPKALGLLHSAQMCSCANIFALLHTPHPQSVPVDERVAPAWQWVQTQPRQAGP